MLFKVLIFGPAFGKRCRYLISVVELSPAFGGRRAREQAVQSPALATVKINYHKGPAMLNAKGAENHRDHVEGRGWEGAGNNRQFFIEKFLTVILVHALGVTCSKICARQVCLERAAV